MISSKSRPRKAVPSLDSATRLHGSAISASSGATDAGASGASRHAFRRRVGAVEPHTGRGRPRSCPAQRPSGPAGGRKLLQKPGLRRPQLMTGPIAFEPGISVWFLSEKARCERVSGSGRWAKLALPLPRRNFAPGNHDIDHGSLLACSC
jgi:hypothetical protein